MARGQRQRWNEARRAFALLAAIALLVKLLVPAGYMPGTSLAQPIMLCPGQGAMPMMAHHAGQRPDSAPHDKADQHCAFAGLGAATLAPALDAPTPVSRLADRGAPLLAGRGLAPGRDMAAPPPPSHAPPTLRA